VRYIRKGDEPESLINLKALANEDWKPTYEDDCRGEVKTQLHNALLKEQGYICCYCQMNITKENSHIEHLKPRSIYPNLALDYKNLLASCQRERERREPQHCGVKKDDWYDEDLMVSPLNENCAGFFRYSPSGEILPTDESDKQEAAKTTIEKLGLGIEKLRLMRSAAIDGALLAIEGLTDEEKLLFAQGYEQPDPDGQYLPFCTAIAYILNQYFIA
jgi:uncharacterized protein (TIGR02646 family)